MREHQKLLRRNIFFLVTIPLILGFLFSPVRAHHPFETGTDSMLQGLLSGLAHPIIGIDHLLFLFSIGLSGFFSLRWIPVLILFGLFGSTMAFFLPSFSGLEACIGLSLVASAAVVAGYLRPVVILPLIAIHGFVLAEVIVGSEPTPLISYILGLTLIQSLLISGGIVFVKNFLAYKKQITIALTLIGLTITYGALFV